MQLMSDLAASFLLDLELLQVTGNHRECCDAIDVMQRAVDYKARHAGCLAKDIKDQQLILPDNILIPASTKHSQLAQQDTLLFGHSQRVRKLEWRLSR